MFTLKRFNDFVSESVKFDNAYKIPNINCQDIIEIKKKINFKSVPLHLKQLTKQKTTNRSLDLLSFIIIYPYKYEASFKI